MKLVKESIEQVLRPKTEIDIFNEIDPLVDKFIANITSQQVEEQVDVINDAKPNHIRKLIDNGEVSYLTNEEGIYDLIDDFAFKISTGKDPQTDDYYFPNQEFSSFWTQFQTSDRIYYDSIMEMMERIFQKFSQKFNIEY